MTYIGDMFKNSHYLNHYLRNNIFHKNSTIDVFCCDLGKLKVMDSGLNPRKIKRL